MWTKNGGTNTNRYESKDYFIHKNKRMNMDEGESEYHVEKRKKKKKL